MGDDVGPVDVARLRSRASWSDAPTAGDDAARAADCARAPTGHLDVVLEPGEVPRCDHCGAALSPEALRRAGIRGRRS